MFRSATTRIAHSSTIPSLGGNLNKDLRALQELIIAEKSVLHSLQKLSTDVAKSAEAFRHWGSGEGEDLADISTGAEALLVHFTSALSRYAYLEESIREQMKAIRTREEQLDDLKRRRKVVASKADAAERKLSRMNPENKNLQSQSDALTKLRDEMRIMDTEIMHEEANLGDFKRYAVKTWMGLKFGGLQECCQKGVIVGELGKLVIAEIPISQTQPGLPRPYYAGHPRTEFLVAEANRVIQEVPFSPEPNQGVPSLNLARYPSPEFTSVQQSPHAPFQPQPQSPRPLSVQYTGAAEAGDSTYPAQMPMSPQEAPMTVSRNGQGPAFGSSSFVGLPQVTPQTPASDFGLGSFLNQGQGSPHVGEKMPEMNEFGAYNAPSSYAPRTSSMNNLVNRESASSMSSPIEAPGGPRGGRFATFPVKGGPRPQPGTSPSVSSAPLPPIMGDRPPSIDVHRNHEESFSSSIAEALGQQWGSSGPSAQQQEDHRPTPIDSKKAAALEDEHRSFNSPPPMYTPEVPSAHPETSTHTSGPIPQGHTEAEEVQLAYMSNPDDSEGESPDNAPDRGDRRVRFGSVRDVDEEMGKREVEQHEAATAQHPPAQQVADIQNARPPSQTTQSESYFTNVPASSPAPPVVVAHRPQTPSTDENHTDEQKALNAAVAREVSRELDALMFSSPIAPHPPPPAIDRTPSPLQPPQPPFARSAVSPRPEGYPPSQSPPPSNRRDSMMSPLSPRNEPQYVRERDRSLPSSPSQTNTSYGSPGHESPLQSPPSISLPDRPSPSASTGTPFRTPPEYPSGGSGSMYNMSASTGSASSFTPGVGGKISAAAFKRQIRQPGSMSPEMGGGDSLGDTNPLSRVPSAPQYGNPPHDSGVGWQQPRSVSATDLTPTDDGPAGHQRLSAAGGASDDDFDYISAYVNNSTSPQPSRTSDSNGLR
ncbi:unnamed protein product [Somion occarium]|uniref:Eisosome component PIL1-domain-containing protein n=1 Tax=Somion occarium TaxID=3059160 RepID=A0ABP1EB12_9APHY